MKNLGFREGETKLRRTPCYNPFFVYVNSNKYELKSIKFYNDNGVVTGVKRGWFGDNNTIDVLTLPEVILRRKPKFDGETFIIGKNGEADIYIPFEYFDFNIVDLVDYSGYYVTIFNRYISKKDSRIWFVDYDKKREVIDTKKKDRAMTLLVFTNGIEKVLDELKKELKDLDYHDRLSYEREKSGLIMSDHNIEKIIRTEYAKRLDNVT